jgi:hypothetical protein
LGHFGLEKFGGNWEEFGGEKRMEGMEHFEGNWPKFGGKEGTNWDEKEGGIWNRIAWKRIGQNAWNIAEISRGHSLVGMFFGWN